MEHKRREQKLSKAKSFCTFSITTLLVEGLQQVSKCFFFLHVCEVSASQSSINLEFNHLTLTFVVKGS